VVERLRALAERWPWLGTALDVHERVGETNGGPVASATTLMFFVALFPMLLVAIAVVGFVSVDNPDLADDVIEALGVDGAAAEVVTSAIDTAQDSRRAATVIGLVGLVWGSLGVAAAVSLAVRAPWQRKDPGVRAKVRGFIWLLGGTLPFLGAVGAGALLNDAPDSVPRWLPALGLVAIGLALELLFFLWTFWINADRKVGWRTVLPGAIAGAIGFEVLKVAGATVVPRMVASSSALYGPIGAVLALLAWFALFARLIVYSSALNATLYEARTGFVTLDVKALRFAGEVPLAADRGGAVVASERRLPGEG
jgi:membrane protein